MVILIFMAVLFILIIAADKVYKRVWDRNLNVSVGFSDGNVTEGEKGELVEKIINDKKLPLPFALISFEMDKSILYEESKNVLKSDKNYRHDCTNIAGKSITERSFPVQYSKRGYYSIEKAEMRIMGINGKKKYISGFSFYSDIYVYPRRSLCVDAKAPFSRITGEVIRNKSFMEDPFEFKGIRDYTGTEPMKKINWRASAKEGRLMVNNYYDTTSRDITIIIDMSHSGVWKEEEKLEELIRIARNYVEDFARKKIPVRIITNALDRNGKTIHFDSGVENSYVTDTLRKMAMFDLTQRPAQISDYLDGHKPENNELTVLLSANPSQTLCTAYDNYIGHENGEWVYPLMGESRPEIGSRRFNLSFVEVAR